MISRKYISAWGEERDRIDVIDLELKRGYPTTFERATVVSYVYEANVLEHANLEAEYGQIESAGIPGIVKLRTGKNLSQGEKVAVVAFLNMHFERGRYADQTKILTPAIGLMRDGSTKNLSLRIADRLILSRYAQGPERLTDRGLEDWRWQVCAAENVATGDGAVLCLASPDDGTRLGAVLFPLSPTQVLVIGAMPEIEIPINAMIEAKSRRWLVGSLGSLNMEPDAFEDTAAT